MSFVSQRVVDRFAAKQETFQESRDKIFEFLEHEGWKLSSKSLKIPHATSPDGSLRLWFRAQAVYFTDGDRHDFGSARSVGYDLDIRKITPTEFVAMISRKFR